MIDFAITFYVLGLFVVYKLTPKVGDSSIFGFRKLTFILAAAEVPYLYTVNHDPELLPPFVLSNITDFDLVFLKFLAIKLMFITVFSITAFHFYGKKIQGQAQVSPNFKTRKFASLNLQLSLLMLFLALLSFQLLVSRVGGLEYLLLSWGNKTIVLQSTALFRTSNLVFGILAIGFFINFIAREKRIRISEVIALIVIVAVVFLVLLSVGERKNPILVVIYTMLTWHFRVRPIRIVSVKNITLLMAFMAFAALFPELRKEGAMEVFAARPSEIFIASLTNWGQVFARLSDLDTSLFIYSYFDDVDKYWFGATWPGVITGFIPSSMFPNKPPIDEGVYIYAMAHSYVFSPPVPFRELIPVGWPVSRVTGLFVHFGTLGVFVAALITGWLMRLISKAALKSKSPAALFIYSWAMLTGFGLTNAFIFNISLMLALLLPVHWFYRARERRLIRKAR